MIDQSLKNAVVRVGDGRGFVVDAARKRYVITAAHCLPHFPPCLTFSHLEERTYEDIVGPIEAKTAVWAECVFVDPIADIAVLGAVDGQALYEEENAFDEFIGPRPALHVAEVPEYRHPRHRLPARADEGLVEAYLLSLTGEWVRCQVRRLRERITISGADSPIVGGMSGSPIFSADGAAIGIVTCGTGTGAYDPQQPALTEALPHWLSAELTGSKDMLAAGESPT